MKKNTSIYCMRIMQDLYQKMLAYEETVARIASQYGKDVSTAEKSAASKYPLSLEPEDTASLFDADKKRERRERIDTETKLISKYREAYIESKKETLIPAAVKAIRDAQNNFHDEAAKVAQDLRRCLEKSINEPINSAFMQHAKILNEFNLPLTEIDCETLLTNSEGHPMAYRIIDSIIKKTESNYSIRYRPLESYNDDIKLIESLATDECFAVPVDNLHEMVELFTGIPIHQEPEDKIRSGSVARYDITLLSAHYGLFKGNLERLGKISGIIESSDNGNDATWIDDTKIAEDFSKTIAKEHAHNGVAAKEAMNDLKEAGYIR